VEAVGDGVTRFRPGDEVYGDDLALKGGFAEYAVAAEAVLAHKPAELTFAEASTIPQAGRSPCRAPRPRRSAGGC
jgi:NADPH:quinone reductase-like Zn-dependent oxidoreductase